MRTFTLLVLFLASSNYCIAQSSYTIKGQILNENTAEPISYSNIGIPGKYIGVAAGEDGFYTLELSPSTESDTLQISAIGFTTKRIPLSVLREKNNQTIVLQPKTYELNSITVSDKKDLETAWIGKEKFGFFGRIFGVGRRSYGRSIPRDNKNIGAVYAFKVKWDKALPIRILLTRMYLQGNINDSPTRLRCRIMSIDSKTGLPEKDLVHYNVIGASNNRGWLSCDFNDKDIYLKQEQFFVVFEWLYDFSKVKGDRIPPLFLTKPDFDSDVLVKTSVFDKWKNLDQNLIYSVKVEY